MLRGRSTIYLYVLSEDSTWQSLWKSRQQNECRSMWPWWCSVHLEESCLAGQKLCSMYDIILLAQSCYRLGLHDLGCCYSLECGMGKALSFHTGKGQDGHSKQNLEVETGRLQPYRVSSPQNKNSVINYSPSCHYKPVRLSFIFGTQMKIFLMTECCPIFFHRLPLQLKLWRFKKFIKRS